MKILISQLSQEGHFRLPSGHRAAGLNSTVSGVHAFEILLLLNGIEHVLLWFTFRRRTCALH